MSDFYGSLIDNAFLGFTFDDMPGTNVGEPINGTANDTANASFGDSVGASVSDSVGGDGGDEAKKSFSGIDSLFDDPHHLDINNNVAAGNENCLSKNTSDNVNTILSNDINSSNNNNNSNGATDNTGHRASSLTDMSDLQNVNMSLSATSAAKQELQQYILSMKQELSIRAKKILADVEHVARQQLQQQPHLERLPPVPAFPAQNKVTAMPVQNLESVQSQDSEVEFMGAQVVIPKTPLNRSPKSSHNSTPQRKRKSTQSLRTPPQPAPQNTSFKRTSGILVTPNGSPVKKVCYMGFPLSEKAKKEAARVGSVSQLWSPEARERRRKMYEKLTVEQAKAMANSTTLFNMEDMRTGEKNLPSETSPINQSCMPTQTGMNTLSYDMMKNIALPSVEKALPKSKRGTPQQKVRNKKTVTFDMQQPASLQPSTSGQLPGHVSNNAASFNQNMAFSSMGMNPFGQNQSAENAFDFDPFSLDMPDMSGAGNFAQNVNVPKESYCPMSGLDPYAAFDSMDFMDTSLVNGQQLNTDPFNMNTSVLDFPNNTMANTQELGPIDDLMSLDPTTFSALDWTELEKSLKTHPNPISTASSSTTESTTAPTQHASTAEESTFSIPSPSPAESLNNSNTTEPTDSLVEYTTLCTPSPPKKQKTAPKKRTTPSKRTPPSERPITDLYEDRFFNLNQDERKRLLLPILHGQDPFDVDAQRRQEQGLAPLVRPDGRGGSEGEGGGAEYGAVRQRAALEKAARLRVEGRRR